MNISFFDGVNDGKFYSINAGKYDEFGEEDIDISEEVNGEIEEDDDTCLNRFAALEKDASKLHMDLNNLRNEFKGSCKDWNNLSDTVDHMLNSIAELKTVMDRADDRLNRRLNVISEANVALTDKLSLVEKKLEVFKCIDILDRVTKLEEQVKPAVLEEAKDLEVRPSVLDDILDRLGKLEERCDTLEEDSISAQQNIANIITKDIRDDVRLHSIDNKLKELKKKTNENLSGTATFESDKNDIRDDPVNHPKHYTDGKYECIDFIHQYGLGFDLGNAVKYITRAGIKSKDTYIQDLEKALWYLEHHIKDPINPVVFSKPNMIPVDDYCHDKMLTNELTRVIKDIVDDNIGTAAWTLTKYIQDLKNEQSK